MTKLSSSTPDRQTDRPALGVALIVASAFCFSMMSLGVRKSGQFFRPDVIVFYRSLTQILVLLPWAAVFFPPRWSLKEKFRTHFGRGAFGILSMYFLYNALQHLPFSLVTPLTLTSILWATLFARIFLKERVSYSQIACAVVVVAGVMLVVISTSDGTGGWRFSAVGVTSALLCGLSMGGALTTLRQMRKSLSTKDIVFFFGWCGVLLTLPFFAANPQFPTTGESLIHILWVGLAASAGQLLMTAGFRYASTFTATLSKHVETVINVGVGMLVLHEFPPWLFYLGLVLVLAGIVGLAIAKRKKNPGVLAG